MSLWSEAIVSHVFPTVECRVVVVDALVIEGHALFRLVFRMLFVFVPFVAFAFDPTILPPFLPERKGIGTRCDEW